jgi:hypothetical protein
VTSEDNDHYPIAELVLRIFGPKREEEGLWIKLHNGLYYSPNIVRAIKARIRWAGHVARTGTGEVFTGVGWEA